MADKTFAAGLVRLIRDLDLPVPLPAVRSRVGGSRLTRITPDEVIEQYPKSYAQEGLVGQIRFAMRYEPLDLGVVRAVFAALEPGVLEDWIRAEPTGIPARRAWYLYELLTGRQLDLPDVAPTGYADLLNPEIHVTGPSVRIRRQRINNNLLGAATYCPLIRRTEALEQARGEGLIGEAQAIVDSCDPRILARAVNYLYTKETKSSFAIEGEVASADRAERFVAALSQADSFDPTRADALIHLQNMIVDARYAAKGWREMQNFVGQTLSDYSELVHFVCPKPADLPDLMTGWEQLAARLRHSAVDPVCAAAALAFGFVFLHPFEDGNGRIHRFLIHQQLAAGAFTPHEILFPVSSVMLRDRRAYDRVLQSYSNSIMPFIRYDLASNGSMTVHNETAHLYRYWDATAFAEYLYSCVAKAIRTDLKEEIGFLRVFDEAVRRTMEIVDMPDRRASLLVRLILQNGGMLSQTKRSTFGELTDAEVARIEEAVRTA